MVLPLIVGAIYRENTLLGFGITIAALLVFGVPMIIQRPKDKRMNVKGGLITVALAWILMSLFATIPIAFSKEIPSYIDVLFEVVSGFTTCGATVVNNVEALSLSILFWRSLSQWIGGMGILVFVIALLPKADGQAMQLFKAESPGPSAGKLVAKLRFTARILYAIYLFFTLLCMILLRVGGMSTFDSVIHAFSTISTGGFSSKTASMGHYNNLYFEIVLMVFMFLGSINFNLFYLLLLGNFKSIIKNEELRAYFVIIAVSVVALTLSLTLNRVYNFGQSVRYSAFSLISMISTTGFTTADFSAWPVFSQLILVFAMFIGGCAGSSAGGFKVSRIVILAKSGSREFRRAINPRLLSNVKVNGKPVENEVVMSTYHYFLIFIAVYFVSVLLVAIGMKGAFSENFVECLTSVLTCLGNVGPGLGSLAMGNFSRFSIFSKLVLIFDMLIGRLEIFPVLMLFYPRAWAKY